jgi:hypothetical protein
MHLQEEEKRQEEERIRTENLMMGNPLLQGAADFSVKKRYGIGNGGQIYEAVFRVVGIVVAVCAKDVLRFTLPVALHIHQLVIYSLLSVRGHMPMNMFTRRWDDDVVFKNCARGVAEKKEATYINDTIRSDFHRKFMKKYVRWAVLRCSRMR